MVDGTVQQVEYGALPTVCFSCGKYGHVKELCPTVVVDQTREETANVVVEAQGGAGGSSDADQRLEFGRWMLVERKARRGQRAHQASGAEKSGIFSSGSRFSALNQAEDLGRDLGVATDVFSQEIVREKGVVGDGGFKFTVNRGVKNNLGPILEAGRGNASGQGALLEPAKEISLGSMGVTDLGQNSNFSLDKYLGKRLMDLANKGKSDEGKNFKLNTDVISRKFLTHLKQASSNRQKRKDLWDALRSSIPSSHIPWIVIGDFNAILSSSEKFGGITNGGRCPQFGDFVEKAELHDLGFRGPPFTWHRGALFERLDRVLDLAVMPKQSVRYYEDIIVTGGDGKREKVRVLV
ncbi:reverse transcriptase [Gossypium australe]|uniref:Reverse transcriptase n=1 Tax=Gossypium australe TaxID=47621 RepID=A0A5B6VSS8_9ROSI|nr:reverse transcriptase [Gossypium australe]